MIPLPEQCRLTPGRMVVVGVSGGADSLCLMEVLRQAGHTITVGHFNHGLRPEAATEADAVAEAAERLGLPFVRGEGDVASAARESRRSIEEAGRILRYDFLFGLARAHGAQAVAVGHTADDQVETVLMHLLRGAGSKGLTGMAYRTVLRQFDEKIPLVRPLLDTWRAETVAFCAAQGLHPLEDASNAAVAFRRNRIRRELLPALETYNPSIRKAILRMAKAVALDREMLGELVDAAWSTAVVQETTEGIHFSVPELRRFSPALRASLIRGAVERLDPLQELDYAATQRALSLLDEQRPDAGVELQGRLRAERRGREFVVREQSAAQLAIDGPQLPEGVDRILLEVPGSTSVGAWSLTSVSQHSSDVVSSIEELIGAARDEGPVFEAWLDEAMLPRALELRIRRPGDRFQPLGMEGHSQKLADFMVNVKMPAHYRRRWPLLCSDNTVIWVPGYRPAHPFRLTENTEDMLHFRLTAVSPSPLA